MSSENRVLLAIPHPGAQGALAAFLTTLSGMDLIGIAQNGLEAYNLVDRWRPDLVIMDMDMPLMDGVEAAFLIKQRWPEVRVVLLATYASQLGSQGGDAADAVVLKGAEPEVMEAAVRGSEEG